MTITLRATKGAPLTISELDANFTDLDDRVIDLEAIQSTARSIEEITQLGNSLVIQYNDSTQDGPFTFTVQITYRGDWTASTVYAVNDLVKANGVIYIVAIAHTSDTTFDPGANNGSGSDYYVTFLDLPELQIPVGGGTGYVLGKASATDYDTEWVNSAVPSGGDTGYILAKATGDDFDTEWVSVPSTAVLTITAATFDANAAAYANVYFRCTNTSGCHVTIPSHATQPFATGTEMHFRQCTLGGFVSIHSEVDSSGDVVTINGIEGYDNETSLNGAVITIKKVSTNTWDLFGLLSAAPSA